MKLYGIRNKETKELVVIESEYSTSNYEFSYTVTCLELYNLKDSVDFENFLFSHKEEDIEYILNRILENTGNEMYYEFSKELINCRELLEVVEIAELGV